MNPFLTLAPIAAAAAITLAPTAGATDTRCDGIPQSDIDAYKTRNRIPETAITAYIAQRQENQ